jgi:hypothetical protein
MEVLLHGSAIEKPLVATSTAPVCFVRPSTFLFSLKKTRDQPMMTKQQN